jgi:hypothetical protein
MMRDRLQSLDPQSQKQMQVSLLKGKGDSLMDMPPPPPAIEQPAEASLLDSWLQKPGEPFTEYLQRRNAPAEQNQNIMDQPRQPQQALEPDPEPILIF